MDTNSAALAAPEATKDDPTIWRVDDALWAELQPLLVIDKPRKKPGRPRLDDRPIFDGLLWLVRNGGQWATLPRQFGAKSTVHARFQEWVEHGCLENAWARLLTVYDDELGLDWQWQAADGCLVKAPLGKKAMVSAVKRSGGLRRVLPGCALAQQGVEDEQQLVHRGGERDFLGSPGRDEALVERADGGVALDGDERAHPARRARGRGLSWPFTPSGATIWHSCGETARKSGRTE